MNKKLTIKNPERLNSKNHLLSGDIVTIKLTASTNEAYHWKISKNYSTPCTFVLERTIQEFKWNDKCIVNCSFHLENETIDSCVHLAELKDRDTVLNQLIEKAKNNFDFGIITNTPF